jgi:hypothetical protein
MFAECHQRMKKIAVDSLVLQRGAITSHSIDHHTLYIVLLDGIDDSCEMEIDIQWDSWGSKTELRCSPKDVHVGLRPRGHFDGSPDCP